MVRALVAEGEFCEVFVDVPVEEAIKRDPKGLYKKALAGELRNFTGIESPYERPRTARSSSTAPPRPQTPPPDGSWTGCWPTSTHDQ